MVRWVLLIIWLRINSRCYSLWINDNDARHVQYIHLSVDVPDELALYSDWIYAPVRAFSEEYFRSTGSGGELDISADYEFFVDPVHIPLNGISSDTGWYIRLSALMNHDYYSDVLFINFGFPLDTNPDPHTESGSLSLKLRVPAGLVNGAIFWDVSSYVSINNSSPIPEPQTYAMLLTGIGLLIARRKYFKLPRWIFLILPARLFRMACDCWSAALALC